MALAPRVLPDGGRPGLARTPARVHAVSLLDVDPISARRAESRQARRHAAEIRGEANAILDAAVLLVSDVLRQQGFALLAPVVARFRMAESGSTGFEIAVRLKDPGHADAAKAAIVERFPDRLSDVVVS